MSKQKKSNRKKTKSLSRWHKFTVQPMAIMLFLCVGVLLVASTINALGDSYKVTGALLADPLVTPALMSDPADGAHVTNPLLHIAGSCPNNSYVLLFLNGAEAGSSNCSGNGFGFNTSLQPGANSLQVQDYNVTDQAGPSSPTITVYYDASAKPTPAPSQPQAGVQPVNLQVMQVDTGVSYVSQQTIEVVSELPTFEGMAPPLSQVTVVVHSNPVVCHTQADVNGFWRCTLKTRLSPGEHSVLISAVTVDGQQLELPIFTVQVVAKATQTQPATASPLAVSTGDYKYKVYSSGSQVSLGNITIAGGLAPYVISVNWGDQSTETINQTTAGPLQLSHHYDLRNTKFKSYTITISVTDSTGATRTVQTITYIRNTTYVPPVSSTKKQPLSGITSGLHAWLWLLWPAYIIITLMFISFWLGEREQYQLDRRKTKAKSRKRHA